MSSAPQVPGVEVVGPWRQGYEQVLTEESLGLLAALAPCLEQLVAAAGEGVVQPGEEVERLRREDLVAALDRVAQHLDFRRHVEHLEGSDLWITALRFSTSRTIVSA